MFDMLAIYTKCQFPLKTPISGNVLCVMLANQLNGCRERRGRGANRWFDKMGGSEGLHGPVRTDEG